MSSPLNKAPKLNHMSGPERQHEGPSRPPSASLLGASGPNPNSRSLHRSDHCNHFHMIYQAIVKLQGRRYTTVRDRPIKGPKLSQGKSSQFLFTQVVYRKESEYINTSIFTSRACLENIRFSSPKQNVSQTNK